MSSIRCWKCKCIFPRRQVEQRWIDGTKRNFCPQDLKTHDGLKLVGTGGVARKQVRNDRFTVGYKNVVPTQMAGYPGRDVRVSCSPEEVEALKTEGFYSKQWRQLRGLNG